MADPSWESDLDETENRPDKRLRTQYVAGLSSNSLPRMASWRAPRLDRRPLHGMACWPRMRAATRCICAMRP